MYTQDYPIGFQDFKEIRKRKKVYIDKTKYIHDLLISYKYYFLSRPRRFGKSLFVSTLNYLFEGQKELFKDLYIHDKWNFEQYPIIKISFSDIGHSTKGLTNAINEKLEDIATQYEIEQNKTETAVDINLKNLILKLYEKYEKQVVLLIDEYDKPIIDNLEKTTLQEAINNRSILKNFYSVLKDADPYLNFVFITGISKFSQVSIFSDLNNLFDLTLRKDYNEICGIGQEELELYFKKELEQYDKEKIKRWYNGYRWNVNANTIYNPYSIFNYFANDGIFSSFWYATGTPTFLAEMCRENKLYNLHDSTLSFVELNSFDLENMQLLPVLFQTGYLTLTKYDPLLDTYHLDYPNIEVRNSYLQGLLHAYSYSKSTIVTNTLTRLLDA